MSNYNFKLLFNIFLFTFLNQLTITFAYNLPDMGSTANTSLSYKDERLLGEYVYLDAQKELPIISNDLIEDYIQTLGNKLLNNSNKHYDSFHFFLVDSQDVNAFAMPGGFVGVNRGLITFAQNESELAAVLAHEITHVNQRHIARSFESQKQMQLPMLAGIIAGALLSAYSPQAGSSIMMGSMAASSQSAINYTRSYEEEADRIGMSVLAKSGYSPYSMGKVFRKLERNSYNDKGNFLKYLSTHPMSETRATEATIRADEIAINKNKTAYFELTNSVDNINNLNFSLIKSLLTTDSINDLKESKITENKSAYAQDITQFTIANDLLKNQEYVKANKILRNLRLKYPNNYIINSYYAKSFNKQPEMALDILNNQLKLTPNNIALQLQYSQIAFNNNKLQLAVDTLKNITKNHIDYPPKINLLLAQCYDKLNQKWQANLAYSDYSIQRGDITGAIMQLKATAKFDKLTSYQSKILNYRIKDLEAKYKDRTSQMQELI